MRFLASKLPVDRLIFTVDGLTFHRGSVHICRGRTHISPWTDSHFAIDRLIFTVDRFIFAVDGLTFRHRQAHIYRGSAHIYRGRTHISPWTDSHFTVDGLTFHRFLLGNPIRFLLSAQAGNPFFLSALLRPPVLILLVSIISDVFF